MNRTSWISVQSNPNIYIYIYKKCWLGDITRKKSIYIKSVDRAILPEKKRPMNNENWTNQKNKCSYYCSFTHLHFCYESVMKIAVDVALFFHNIFWKLRFVWKHKNLFRHPIKILRLSCFYSNLSKCRNKSKWSTINRYYSSA